MSFELRDYQKEAVENVYKSWEKHRSICLVLPTGGGKSKLAQEIIKEHINQGKKVLVIVHRQELLDQMVGHLKSASLHPGTIQGRKTFFSRLPLQVASVQTLHRRKDTIKEKWYPDLIVVDETHHVKARTWHESLDTFSNAKVLGLTATPYRLDGTGFENIFEDMIVCTTTKDLIDRGYLSKFKIYSVPVIDVSNVSKKGGDFVVSELTNVVDDAKYTADAVETWKSLALGDKTIVFACSVEHSKHVTDAYNEFGRAFYGHDIAVHIDGAIASGERSKLVTQFREDPKTLILSNVNIATEGFDLPEVTTVQCLRPTESLSLHLQILGRALRVSPGKTHAKILDHAGNCYRHGRPDRVIEWSLDGYKKLEPKEIQCIFCGELYLRNEIFKGMECKVCSAPFEWESQVRKPKALDELTVDESRELVEMNESDAVTLLLGCYLAYKKKNVGNPEWKAYLDFYKQEGLTYEDFKRAEEILGYKRGFGLKAYLRYENGFPALDKKAS